MAGPLQGPAAGSLDRTPYGTGRGAAAGGKIRSARHHQNFNQDHQVSKPGGVRRGPYDRPVGRNPPQPAARRGAWIGSRILSGASSFLSSLFRRDGDETLALPAPPPPQSYQEGLVNHDVNFGGSGDQIEDLLKDRIFTREQCDRFIKVLQSKLQPTIPNGLVGDRDQRYPEDELERERENEGERDRLAHRNMDHHEDSGSSPVDIAKAYMDKRLSPVPASVFPIRTLDYERTHEEYRATTPRVAPTPLSHIRIATPGHTPYVRLPKQRPNNVRATPYPVEKKRRVDDELEYTGRRTKLKMTPANGPPVSLLPSASNGGFAGSYSDRMKNLQRKRWEKRSKEDSAAAVPMQSSETARRILETLEILTPPKVMSLEEELAVVREKRPKELSPSMMSEQARKTELTLECPLSDALQDHSPSHRATETGEPSSSAAPVTTSAEPAENDAKGKAVTTSPELSSRPWSPVSAQMTKGFRMNAAMEESNSDDEVQPIATPAVSTPSETKTTQLFASPSSVADSKPSSPPLATLTVPAAESKSMFAFSTAPAAEKKATFEVQNSSLLFTTSPATSTAAETKSTQLFGFATDSKPAFALAATSTVAATEGKATVAFPSTAVAEKKLFAGFESSHSTAPSFTAASKSGPLFMATTETKSTQPFGSSNDSGTLFAFGAASTAPVAESRGAFGFSSVPVVEKKSASEFPTQEIKSFTAPSAVSKAVETKSTPLFASSSSATDITPSTTTPAMPAAESKATFAFSSAPVAENKASFEFLASQTSETKPAFSFIATPASATSKPVFAPVPAAESKPAFSFTNAPPAEKKAGFEFGGVTTPASFTFGSNTNTSPSIFGIASSAPSPTTGTSSALGTGDMEQDMAEEPASAVQTSQPVAFGNTPVPAAQPFVFGSPPPALPTFGAASAPDFGAHQTSAPAFGGFGSQPFSSQSSPFGAAATSGSATTPASVQPFVFGSSPPAPAFGAASAPSFGGGSPQANPFASQPPFGSQPSIFGAQQPGAGATPAAPVFGSQPAGANPFSGFSGFTVGAGNADGEQRTRKLFKAKRTGASKRGK
ncbi:nuclear pore complex protein DDB_G0274915-like [Selaginella moellendorffii]|uniref:nuclear pore complex protein DDB_G0274915-like n=1 Tax=Selaginella moellendorffii TaxID=88036 RepID=UPI000D1C94AF|nr:nuclear pore complex protein DDB_G0274915-like [Selaginella moellendorffii]|eukprot:XP_024520744.1 nuclear pore complex protein DDB_G0274915-like [Selaginella moellendorffii]